MALSFEFEAQDPRAPFYQERTQLEAFEAALQVDDIEEALELIYPSERIHQLTDDLLEETSFFEKKDGRKWAVAIIPSDDPRADIARRIENERFSKFFKHHPAEHYVDYGIYDHASIFVTVIDTEHPDGPKGAAALRIVRNSEVGLKTINTLSMPSPDENPWQPELSNIFGNFDYSEREVVQRGIEQMFQVNPDTTWAIETMAVLEEYAGKKGEFGAASLPLYAACLQLSNRSGIESWISIQDIKPLMQMQTIFSNPWSLTPLSVQNYEGEYPTIPAVMHDMEEAQAKLREVDPATASLFIDGEGMSIEYMMPEELQGAEYLDYVAANYAKPS